jgi:predicted N-acetyltransferase YhbS
MTKGVFMNIRPIRTDDEIKEAYELEISCYPPEAAATLSAFYLRRELFPSYFLIAEMNEEVVGIVNGVLTNDVDLSNDALKQNVDFNKDGSYLCILTLAVKPTHRGQHIAVQLINQIIEQAKKEPLSAIILMCESPLIPFYEKFGFVYLRPSSSEHGGIEWYEMRLDC